MDGVSTLPASLLLSVFITFCFDLVVVAVNAQNCETDFYLWFGDLCFTHDTLQFTKHSKYQSPLHQPQAMLNLSFWSQTWWMPQLYYFDRGFPIHSFLHFICFDLTKVSLTSGSPKAPGSAYRSQKKCMVFIFVSFVVVVVACSFFLYWVVWWGIVIFWREKKGELYPNICLFWSNWSCFWWNSPAQT